MLITVWSPKHGSGVSTIAAALAIAADRPVRLVDLDEDQSAIFGMACDPIGGLHEELTASSGEAVWSHAFHVAPHVMLLSRGARAIDALDNAALARHVRAWQVSDELHIVDAGSADTGAAHACIDGADISLVVLRPCYLALRRAVRHGRVAESDGLIVIEDPDRPLRAREVADVVQRPILGRVPVRAAIARAIDAGVFSTRFPAELRAPVVSALEILGVNRPGRAA
ncbi:MAG: hypothetical protein ACOYN3_04760 [Acidimicrobiia bacterium]